MGCCGGDGAGWELVLLEVAGGGGAEFGRVGARARPGGTAAPVVWYGEPGRRGLEVACEGGWRYGRHGVGCAFDIPAGWVCRGSGGRGSNRGVRAIITTAAIGWNVPGWAVGGVGL